jgi:nucleoside-triphosphatase THEP1
MLGFVVLEAPMTTARWALVSAERMEESTACALSVVARLEAAGIRTAGFAQHKDADAHGQKRYEVVRLHSQERALLAVDGTAAKGENEESFCSIVFHNDSFATARRWAEEDKHEAELFLLGGVGKLEVFDKGHSPLLEGLLKEDGALLLLCVRASQLSYVMERFVFPEERMVDALELPAPPHAVEGFVESLKASCLARRAR